MNLKQTTIICDISKATFYDTLSVFCCCEVTLESVYFKQKLQNAIKFNNQLQTRQFYWNKCCIYCIQFVHWQFS